MKRFWVKEEFEMADKKLKVTLIKSTIGAVPKNKKTIEALGLTKLYKTVDFSCLLCDNRHGIRKYQDQNIWRL